MPDFNRDTVRKGAEKLMAGRVFFSVSMSLEVFTSTPSPTLTT